MASWRSPQLHGFVAMAVVAVAGCKQAGAERQSARAAGGGEAAGSSLPKAPPPPSASARDEAEHDCSLHSPGAHEPLPPSATKLSAQARTRMTALRVLAHGSAVIIRKGPDGWVVGGPDGCAVSSQRVERALDNLGSLRVVASGEPPQQPDRQIILLDGAEVLLQYDVGVGAGGADPARLPDGSVVQLRGLERGLWSSQPNDWCQARP